ncbi:MAG: GlsB/YeaQ/YmgE family stress response membrane protein [Pseudomonadota bacterium]
MDVKALAIMAVIGVVAGFLASLVVGGAGSLLGYLIAGVLGAFVGGFVFNALGIKLSVGNPLVSQIITSTVGAMIVIIIARFIT